MSIRNELIRAINEVDRLRAECKQYKRENKRLRAEIDALKGGASELEKPVQHRPAKRKQSKQEDTGDAEPIGISKVNEGRHEV